MKNSQFLPIPIAKGMSEESSLIDATHSLAYTQNMLIKNSRAYSIGNFSIVDDYTLSRTYGFTGYIYSDTSTIFVYTFQGPDDTITIETVGTVANWPWSTALAIQSTIFDTETIKQIIYFMGNWYLLTATGTPNSISKLYKINSGTPGSLTLTYTFSSFVPMVKVFCNFMMAIIDNKVMWSNGVTLTDWSTGLAGSITFPSGYVSASDKQYYDRNCYLFISGMYLFVFMYPNQVYVLAYVGEPKVFDIVKHQETIFWKFISVVGQKAVLFSYQGIVLYDDAGVQPVPLITPTLTLQITGLRNTLETTGIHPFSNTFAELEDTTYIAYNSFYESSTNSVTFILGGSTNTHIVLIPIDNPTQVIHGLIPCSYTADLRCHQEYSTTGTTPTLLFYHYRDKIRTQYALSSASNISGITSYFITKGLVSPQGILRILGINLTISYWGTITLYYATDFYNPTWTSVFTETIAENSALHGKTRCVKIPLNLATSDKPIFFKFVLSAGKMVLDDFKVECTGV